MESLDNVALNEGPEAFDRIGVDGADDAPHYVLALPVVRDSVRIAIMKSNTASEIDSPKQADADRNGLIDEDFQRLALHGADDGHLVFTFATAARMGFLPPCCRGRGDCPSRPSAVRPK